MRAIFSLVELIRKIKINAIVFLVISSGGKKLNFVFRKESTFSVFCGQNLDVLQSLV